MNTRWLRSDLAAKAACFVVLLGSICIYVLMRATGGSASPYFPLLLIPVLLSSVTCRFVLSVALGFALAIGTAWIDGQPHPLGTARGSTIFGLALCGALYARSVRRERRMMFQALAQKDALLDASRIISASDDLESAVESALQILPKLVPDFRCAALFLEDDSDGSMRLYDVIGCKRDDLAFTSFDPNRAESRWRPTDPAPLYVSDANALPSAPIANLDARAQSALCLSLQSPRAFTASVGMLYISSGRARAFSNEQIGLLQEFADLIGFPLQKVRVQEGLQSLAFTDALTGLANYRYFRAELEEEVKRAARYRHPLSLIMIDLDLFKSVNDRYGHQVGDSALRWLAGLIRDNVREADFPARYGGEEFVVICSEALGEEALVVAERIRAAVAEAPFRMESGERIPLSVSVGVASHLEAGLRDADLIRSADDALYTAKRSGRNRVHTFEQHHLPERRSA